MLFGKLLEGSQDTDEYALLEMEQELRAEIQRVKLAADCCKAPTEAEEVKFITNANGELILPEFKPEEVNYSEMFWKTYLKNQIGFAMVKEYTEKAEGLQEQVQKLENLQESYFKLYKIKNRKKNRRLAVEIEKNFTCPYEKCYKIYGTDVSLNLHIKLKHNGGNKTDREKLAEEICKAENRGEALPEMRLNLPPGYLEEFRLTWREKHEEKHKYS